MVGLFINSLPVRILVREDETRLDFFKRIQQEAAAAREFEYYAPNLMDQVAELASGAPLYESLFVYENYPMDENLMGGSIDLELLLEHSVERMPYALHVMAVETKQGLRIQIGYDGGRFKREDATHIGTMLQTILQSDVAHLGD